MGWWKNDAGEVTGDDTADAVSNDLKALATILGRKLTLPELLGYVHHVLAAKSRDLLAPETDVPPLVADIELFGDDAPIPETVGMTVADDVTIRQHVDAMCARVSDLYEAHVKRRPTLAEMLESIRFPLGARPDLFVELPRDASVREIRRAP
ncbi:MAG: hypothetical protein ABI591_25745 [Kofleriaceae bacterium]